MTTTRAQSRRPNNLALIYQEVLTAIVRLRGNLQSVSDPDAFRHHSREALKAAARQALAAGYAAEDIKLATFAAVAFLDESVLNSKQPIFGDWLRKPLQEELFGTNVAGDIFFQNLQQLLGRTDSADLADLLEIHHLCMLLGFDGRHNANRGELKRMQDAIVEKLHRIRGTLGPLAPAAMPPDDALKVRRDPWLRRLAIAATACAILLAVLFTAYKISLHSMTAEMQALAAEARK